VAPFFIRVVNQTLLFVALEDAVDGAANHGDGTTVDRVDGIAASLCHLSMRCA